MKTCTLQIEMGHNATEATKIICCLKGQSAADHSTVTRLFKKFYLGCKNLNNKVMSGSHKTMDKVIEVNLASST